MEKDKKELIGEVSETQSSDAFIERQLATLKSDNYGLNDQVVDVLSDDLLLPLSTSILEEHNSDAISNLRTTTTLSKITYKHSAFGANVQELRNKKKQSKKAA